MATHQPTPYCLALTGGIACGKSTVGALLAERGLFRVDSDQVARDVVLPGTAGFEQVVARFGPEVVQVDGTLDRRALGQIVFASTSARRELESLLHPLIWNTLSAEMAVAARQRRETVFEIPLLYENGNDGRFSTVWVVSADPSVQMQRLMERDRLDAQQAQARLDAQMSVEEKAARATFVIVNNGEPEAVHSQIDKGLDLWRRGFS